MDINYLYSIVDLYLKKETNEKKTYLSIVKIENDRIQFSFNMDEKDVDVTSFSIPSEEVFENDNFYQLIRTYKQSNIIIDEKYTDDNSGSYYVLLNNGRKILFKNFSVIEINDIRNIIYDIKFQKEEIRIDFLDDEDIDNKYYYTLRPTGFANFKTILVIAVCFLVVFIISLWLFNVCMG